MTAVVHHLESRRTRIGRWVAAGLIVTALHVGVLAVAIMQQHEEESDDAAAGALTVELAPLPAPKPVDTPDVAHGPEQQVAKLTPEASKPVMQKVEEDIPPVDPSPAPQPEMALPKPKPKEKEQPKEEPAAEKHEPQQDADVPVTTAPLRVEAPPTARAAKSEGQAAKIAQAQAAWQTALMRQLNRHKRVPPGARGRRGQWVIVVAFTLDRTGKVVVSRITKSSGLPVLDDEALDLLRRVTFPPAPDQLPGATFEYSLPIKFGVN
jgi:protein TonB